MEENKICPFLREECNKNCVFYLKSPVSMGRGIPPSHCLIAVKLSDINEFQHDDLTQIVNSLEK